jgi:cytosine deaminase
MAAELGPVLLPDGRVARLGLDGARIASVTPTKEAPTAVALPLPIDPHLHLDKTFTAYRCRASEPGLFGAIKAMDGDKPRWTEDDLRDRMGQALQRIWMAGYAAVRSHIDWPTPAEPLAWRVLSDAAAETPELHVERAALVPLDLLGDPGAGPPIAVRVADTGGVLGAFAYRNDDLPDKLARVFDLAERHGLRLDFHVDEGLDPEARGFDVIADLTRRSGMAGRVLCGHACSLSVLPEDELRRSLECAAEAGVALTVMPTTNLHLQDTKPGRSPRRRGLAPLQEASEAGLSICIAADNVRDPFYPHGAYDPLHVLRTAVLAAHLAPTEWLDALTAAPARAMGLPVPVLAPGSLADMLLIAARDWDEAVSDPRVQIRVIRGGQEQAQKETAP